MGFLDFMKLKFNFGGATAPKRPRTRPPACPVCRGRPTPMAIVLPCGCIAVRRSVCQCCGGTGLIPAKLVRGLHPIAAVHQALAYGHCFRSN